MQKAPIAGRTNLAAGNDRQSPNESVPVRNRIVPGITSVTMPGSKMMARTCFHIVVACPSQALFEVHVVQCMATENDRYTAPPPVT